MSECVFCDACCCTSCLFYLFHQNRHKMSFILHEPRITCLTVSVGSAVRAYSAGHLSLAPIASPGDWLLCPKQHIWGPSIAGTKSKSRRLVTRSQTAGRVWPCLRRVTAEGCVCRWPRPMLEGGRGALLTQARCRHARDAGRRCRRIGRQAFEREAAGRLTSGGGIVGQLDIVFVNVSASAL